MTAGPVSRPPGPVRVTRRPWCVVVTGVSATGKTTVARELARRLGLPCGEADDFHPAANIEKMSAGVPLDDADRESWLKAIGQWLNERTTAGTGCVATCSALRRRHRDLLRTLCPAAFFVQLTADRATLRRRMGGRTGHFMPLDLLDSQLATLQPLEADEPGVPVDAGPPPADVVDRILQLLTDRR